jgi:tetratricopeptide (TPR) repeat protein
MTINRYVRILSLVLFILVREIANGQVNDYEREMKLINDENVRFENELKENVDSAEVYWKHANITTQFTFHRIDAWEFYQKAISIDSSKVQYFIDYGKHLIGMNDLYIARRLYKRGIRLFPSNNDIKIGLDEVSKLISENEENVKLSHFGNAPTLGHTKSSEYSKVTDFVNLAKLTTDEKSPFFYKDLLAKFNANFELNDEQVYMLLIGYTQQEAYDPYTQEVDQITQLNIPEKRKEAISKAIELLKTNPLSTELYKELIFAYRKMGNMELADSYQKKLQRILNASLYTGDGTCDRPYVVFWVREEYTLLKYLDLNRTGAIYMGNCAGQMSDKFLVTNMTTQEKTNIHFNTTLILSKERIMNKNGL